MDAVDTLYANTRNNSIEDIEWTAVSVEGEGHKFDMRESPQKNMAFIEARHGLMGQ